jgi:putative polyhydroxyalkanoate system protein
MSQIQLKQNHSLPLDEAKKRLSNLGVTERERVNRFNIKLAWENQNRAKITAKGFQGILKISPTYCTVDGKLGFLARPFAGQIRSTIAEIMRNSLR